MMKYIAHRGASKRYIENTYKAFKYAFESSFDGCECDIRITRDTHSLYTMTKTY